MIDSLYECFKHWSAAGSVWIISDTHFCDSDCQLMDKEWITPEKHIENINLVVHKNDYLIHLGDVGNPEYLKELKCRNRVLIMGNHDVSIERYRPYFKEIYAGPLFIAPKILLSHEPVKGIEGVCLNIHGHDHGNTMLRHIEENRINLASNVYPVKYTPTNLKDIIKAGYMSKVKGIHRETIDYQTEQSLLKRGKDEINKDNKDIKDTKDNKEEYRDIVQKLNRIAGCYWLEECNKECEGCNFYVDTKEKEEIIRKAAKIIAKTK